MLELVSTFDVRFDMDFDCKIILEIKWQKNKFYGVKLSPLGK